MLEFKPGIFQNIKDTDYHAAPGISKHGLDLVNKSYSHYKETIIEDSPVMAFGRAFHSLILTPDDFLRDFAVSPYDDFRTRAAKEWKLEQGDKTVIPAKDWKHLKIMGEKIFNHDKAGALLDPYEGIAEQSIFWFDKLTGEFCRCRPDFVNNKFTVAIDLKTAACAGKSAFTRDIIRYRYHVQAAFYLDGLKAVGIECSDFYFVAIEKTPPYAIACYMLDYDALELGRDLYRKDLDKYSLCMNNINGVDKSYPDEIRVINLPRYAHSPDEY